MNDQRNSHPAHCNDFSTGEGKEDLIAMSRDAYEQRQGRLGLYRLLAEAEADFQNGDRGVSVESIRQRLLQ